MQEQFPAVRVGSWAMVVLPGEIDMAGAPGLGAELDGALAQGVSVLVVDMTGSVHEGWLRKGDNPVLITFDIVLEPV